MKYSSFVFLPHGHRVTLSDDGVLWRELCLTGEHHGPSMSARLGPGSLELLSVSR